MGELLTIRVGQYSCNRLLDYATVSLPAINTKRNDRADKAVSGETLMIGLDADHISAIDNATRQLVSQGQLPITCGKLSSHAGG